MPKPISFVFGSLRTDGTLSYPMFIGQLIIILYSVIISLVNVGQMTQEDGYHWLAWPTVFLGLIGFTISLVRRKQNK